MDAEPPNPLAGLHTACTDSARRLISLWDMNKFLAPTFIKDLERLKWLRETGIRHVDPEGCIDGAEGFRNWRWKSKLWSRDIESIKQHANTMEMIESRGRCEGFLRLLNSSTVPDRFCPGEAETPLSRAQIVSEIEGIEDAVRRELDAQLFLHIPIKKAPLFEGKALFGRRFHKSASRYLKAEIRAAGNCLAADLNTAAVFHLMRVVEIGLRAVARKLQVTVTVGKSRSSICPINEPTCPLGKSRKVTKKLRLEFAQWQQIISAIDEKAKSLPKARAGRLKDAMSSFYYFKEVWRNNVMHSRETYDADQAGRVFLQVKEFMRQLACWVRLL